MRKNPQPPKATVSDGICLVSSVWDFALLSSACGFGGVFVVYEEVSQGVYRVVVQAVFERQFASGSTAGFGIMIAPHRLYQPLAQFWGVRSDVNHQKMFRLNEIFARNLLDKYQTPLFYAERKVKGMLEFCRCYLVP